MENILNRNLINEKFDFIFIDGAKEKYDKFLKFAFKISIKVELFLLMMPYFTVMF